MSIQGTSASTVRFPELRPPRLGTAPPAREPLADAAPAREPSLWEALTEEERAFFGQQAALGPLTYGKPRSAAPSAAPTGQRLDVRA